MCPDLLCAGAVNGDDRCAPAAVPLRPDSVVLLDEAHHLTRAWGAQIAEALQGHRVLGLTATPPYDNLHFAAFIALLLALAPLAPLLFSPFLFITHNPILAHPLLNVKNKKT